MTLVYIVALLLQAAIIVYMIWRSRRAKAVAAAAVADDDSYDARRLQALRVTPAMLKLAIPDDRWLVYGVVMDWNMGDSMVTLASYITGAAALYLSAGGGVDSAGNAPAVGEAAVEFVLEGGKVTDRAIATSAPQLPAAGWVRFFLLTNKGMYAVQESVDSFDNHSSPLLEIFTRGNEVIAAMKKSINPDHETKQYDQNSEQARSDPGSRDL